MAGLFYINVISIRAPLAGSDDDARLVARNLLISIRAPLAGSDKCFGDFASLRIYFNPRSPCGERLFHPEVTNTYRQFQSALPLRGATQALQTGVPYMGFQSALPLRGATTLTLLDCETVMISIRAPLAGSDAIEGKLSYRSWEFQSALPLRGATLNIF